MRYYGIQTPEREGRKSYIWWIAPDKSSCWTAFFKFPGKDNEIFPSHVQIAEAISAYEAIGYQCVELDVSIRSGSPEKSCFDKSPITQINTIELESLLKKHKQKWNVSNKSDCEDFRLFMAMITELLIRTESEN